jgi:hypothetical protein
MRDHADMVAASNVRSVRTPASLLRKILRENGLSLAFALLFVIAAAGQVLTGRSEYNQEREQHGQPSVSIGS